MPDFSQLESQRFESDLALAAGFKPITEKDLKDAYARYKEVGVKPGRVKGKSDTQLYQQAVNDVLAWWKLNKKKESAAKAAAKKAEQAAKQREKAARDAARRAAEQQRQARSSTGGGTGGAGAYGGSMLPDTALPKTAPRSQRPSTDYVVQQLRRNGLMGAVPPTSALKSKKAFDAWVKRALDWIRRQQGKSVAVRDPRTGKLKVVTTQPVATNRQPVVR